MVFTSALEAQLLEDAYSLSARRMARLSIPSLEAQPKRCAPHSSACEVLALTEAQLFGNTWQELHFKPSRRADMIECWIDKHTTQSVSISVNGTVDSTHCGQSSTVNSTSKSEDKSVEAALALDQDNDTPMGKVRKLNQRWHRKKTMKTPVSPRSKQRASEKSTDLAASTPQQELQKAIPPLPPLEELEAWFKKLREWRCSKCNECFSSPSMLYSHTGRHH